MSKHLRKSVALLLLLSIVFMYVPLSLAATGGGRDISLRQRAAIETLAEYATGSTDWVGKALQKYCYEPSVAASTWQHFPAVRKLAIAYEAAEAANPGAGGDMLLALMSKALAQQYEAVRQELSLVKYLKMRVAVGRCLKFRNAEQRVFLSELPYDAREAIRTIAEYSTSSPLGSPQAILRFILKDNPNFNEDDAEGFLCQSLTNADAFTRALTFSPPSKQIALIKELVAKLVVHYEAARYEPAFKPFMPETVTGNVLAQSARPRIVYPQQDFEGNDNRSNRLRQGSRSAERYSRPTPSINSYQYESGGIGAQPTNTELPALGRPLINVAPTPQRSLKPKPQTALNPGATGTNRFSQRRNDAAVRRGMFGGGSSTAPLPRQSESIPARPSNRPVQILVAPNVKPPAPVRMTTIPRRGPLITRRECP